MVSNLSIILKKYKTYVSNIEWHIKTNDPIGKDLELCNSKLDNFKEIVDDLEKQMFIVQVDGRANRITKKNYVAEILHGMFPVHAPQKSYRDVVYSLRSAMLSAKDLPTGSALTGQLVDIACLIWDYEQSRLYSESSSTREAELADTKGLAEALWQKFSASLSNNYSEALFVSEITPFLNSVFNNWRENNLTIKFQKGVQVSDTNLEGYVASIDQLNVCVSAEDRVDAIKEVIKSVSVLLAYNSGINSDELIEAFQLLHGRTKEDKNFTVRLKAAIEKRMEQAGIFDCMLNSAISYDGYSKSKKKFFKSLENITVNYLQGEK